MAMIRRFVNIVAENYRTGVYSVHRLDVSKHLFYPSTLHAHCIAADGGGVTERLQELPSPCTRILQSPDATVADSSKMAFFGLMRHGSSEGRILYVNWAGDSMMYDADKRVTSCMPNLEGFKGPVSVSLSIPPSPGAEEEGMYIMHGVADGPPESKSRFDALRADTACWNNDDCCYWQSLPPPPFACGPTGGLISSYTLLEGGRTICLSSSTAAEGGGTYCFDTVRGEWWRAGDWVMPFAGRAEYVAELNLWLGFSLQSSHDLCAASILPAMGTNQAPTPQHLWQDHTPEEGMVATNVILLSLGSLRFAIAKIFKVTEGSGDVVVGDEFLVLTGVEISSHLQTFQHKSIRYMCSHNRIHQVL